MDSAMVAGGGPGVGRAGSKVVPALAGRQPRFQIVNNRLVGGGVRHVQTPHVRGVLDPEFITLHESAGAMTKGGLTRYQLSNETPYAYHVAIEIDGSPVQQADFNQRTWHVGSNDHRGRRGENGNAIGICLVGPGRMSDKDGDGDADTYFGPDENDLNIRTARGKLPHTSPGQWMVYTQAQRDTLMAILEAVVKAYAINGIWGHWEATTRKEDPNPTLDMHALRQAVRIPSPGMSTVLAVGKRNPAGMVMEVQTRLNELRYNVGVIDGRYGSRTREKVREFQEQAGLDVDGRVGPKTWDALMATAAPVMVVSEWRQTIERSDLPASRTIAGAETAKAAGEDVKSITRKTVVGLGGGYAIVETMSATAKAWHETLGPITGLVQFVSQNFQFILMAGLGFAGFLVLRKIKDVEAGSDQVIAARIDDARTAVNGKVA